MRTIYIDSEFKCHTTNIDGSFLKVETNFFNGKCDAFIEGYQFIPSDKSWTRKDGKTFYGEMISPWKKYSELDDIQRVYEQHRILELESQQEELNSSYIEGVNSI